MSTRETYRFTLDGDGVVSGWKRGKKEHCPGCERPGKFTRYVDRVEGTYLPPQYGKCDRENNCKYHLNPYNDGYADHLKDGQESDFESQYDYTPPEPEPLPAITPLSRTELVATQADRELSQFRAEILRLADTVGLKDRTVEVLKLYGVGYRGSDLVLFNYIDSSRQYRNAKFMRYGRNGDPLKRVKEGQGNTWAKCTGDAFRYCLYGEHLLDVFADLPVAIVEAEKTALICAIFDPGTVYLATGGASTLGDAQKRREKFEALKGRDVLLFTDADHKGRKGFGELLEDLERHLVQSRLLDPFPLREDGHDLADEIITGIRSVAESEKTPEIASKVPLSGDEAALVGDEVQLGDALNQGPLNQNAPEGYNETLPPDNTLVLNDTIREGVGNTDTPGKKGIAFHDTPTTAEGISNVDNLPSAQPRPDNADNLPSELPTPDNTIISNDGIQDGSDNTVGNYDSITEKSTADIHDITAGIEKASSASKTEAQPEAKAKHTGKQNGSTTAKVLEAKPKQTPSNAKAVPADADAVRWRREDGVETYGTFEDQQTAKRVLEKAPNIRKLARAFDASIYVAPGYLLRDETEVELDRFFDRMLPGASAIDLQNDKPVIAA